MKKLWLLFGAAAAALAGLHGSYLLPLDHPAIQYNKAPVDDAVTRLQKRLDTGKVKLQFEDGFGYLRSVLQAMGVLQSSQMLVFSKTSFQAPLISPRTPRALYFKDDLAVGFVRTGEVLEFAALDPKQGVVFYTLNQEPSAQPHFDRRDTCLQCHQSGATLGIVGLMVRSIYPDSTGMPLFQAGTFITDHRSPLKERWGGWYVTGTTGSQVHMGNAVVRDRNQPDKLETGDAQNLTDLRSHIDTGAYLTPDSDIVALMTLEHQTQMVNYIIRVGWETRMALHDNAAMNEALGRPAGTVSESTSHRINSAVEEMLEYMLFTEETTLTSPIKGTSGFTEEFAREGPRDSHGRSLRDFDLKTRMFRYPCSYMIYSEAFDAMPAAAKDRLYRRLFDVLTGKDSSKAFARLTAADRKAILEILRETKKGLPDYWRADS
ncbi:MAG: hypothetical protein ABI165_19020 [Bryobacteraceae bacterium]